MRLPHLGTVLLATAVVVTAVAGGGAAQMPATALPQPANAIGRLEQQIAAGALPSQDDRFGRLPALLERLAVPIDSQVLVFSKTSFQAPHITPRTPRALYFNDDVYVGAVQDGQVFEVIATDPTDGLAYYTLDARPGEAGGFVRRHAECTTCHGPDLMVQSVLPGPDGSPIAVVGGGALPTIDHRTQIQSRWGGWYVTGTHGSVEHLGNAVVRQPDAQIELETAGTQNRVSLEDKIDTARYLAPTSDIVALLTLEHQTRMTNLINAVSRQARMSARAATPAAAASPLDVAIDQLLVYMLFTDEAPLPGPVRGVSTFTQTFAARGPRDPQGRSLRDFDLQKRMFRYPLSYMIYSEAFDAIPAAAREQVYDRLFAVLTGRDRRPAYTSLTAQDRRAVLEIVRETKSDLPAAWRALPETPQAEDADPRPAR
jgi:hypothetical protein